MTSSGVASPSIGRGGKPKPLGYVDEDHIVQFWDDILRFIATIKLKETTASEIFRRLNSYSSNTACTKR